MKVRPKNATKYDAFYLCDYTDIPKFMQFLTEVLLYELSIKPDKVEVKCDLKNFPTVTLSVHIFIDGAEHVHHITDHEWMVIASATTIWVIDNETFGRWYE